MKWIVTLCAVAAGVSALTPSCTIAEETLTPQEFFAAYEPAAKRLEAVYGTARIEGQYRRTGFQGQKDETQSLVIGTLGDKIRVDREILEGRQAGRRSAFVVSRDGSFRVTAAGSGFALDDVTSNYASSLEDARLVCKHYCAPFTIFEATALDFLRTTDGLSIESIRYVNRESDPQRRLVEVRHRRRGVMKDGTAYDSPGRLWFDPERGWALVGYVMGKETGAKPDLRADMAYEGDVDGVPILKSAEYYYAPAAGPGASKGPKTKIERYEVTKFDPAPPAESDFTLQSFGLPDVQGPTPGPGRYTILYVGLGILAAGIALRLWLARR